MGGFDNHSQLDNQSEKDSVCIGNHTVSSSIWNEFARVSLSKS